MNKKYAGKVRSLLAVAAMGTLLAACGAKEEVSHMRQGMDAVEALEYEEALDFFAQALEDGEDERIVYRGMGLAYMGMTKYGDAVAYLEAALHAGGGKVEDIDFDINYYLATAYYKNGQSQQAIDAYSAILALRPKEKDAYYLRGCVKLSGNDFDGAQADFGKAVALDDKNYDQMIRIYTALEEYGYKGDYEQARDRLSNLDSATDYGAALYLGRTYEALGDYNYASSIYAGYVENDKDKAEIYNQLGLCRMQMGEYEAARTAFQEAMKIEDNGMMQTLKFNEIVSYEYMKDYKTAAALMDSYLKSYPDDETAKREYEFLRTR